MNKIKIKLNHADAVIPVKANEDDAGYDLFAATDPVFNGQYLEYDTGISIEPPSGYYTEVVPRSSISKYDLLLCNSVGIIDPSYRGNIKLRFKVTQPYENALIYKKGDRIGQLILRSLLTSEFELVSDLTETSRGSGGFGSTGR
jgi:dUTP pyrophosphatase